MVDIDDLKADFLDTEFDRKEFILNPEDLFDAGGPSRANYTRCNDSNPADVIGV